MNKTNINLITSGLLVLFFASSLAAQEISYDEYGRPVLIQGLQVDGTNHFARISYDTSMANIWKLPEGSFEPKYMNNKEGAVAAMTAMLQALKDGGFDGASLQRPSTPWIPFGWVDWTIDYYEGVYAILGPEDPLVQTIGSAYYNQVYDSGSGFVSFGLFRDDFESPVDVQKTMGSESGAKID